MVTEAPKEQVGRLGDLRPTVNFANYITVPPGRVWGPRINPDSQLVYIVSGGATLELAGRLIEAAPGHCLFYGSETPHRLSAQANEPLTLSSIHFSWNAPSLEPRHPVPGIRDCREEDLSLPAKAYEVEVEGSGPAVMQHLYDRKGLEPLFHELAKEFIEEAPGAGAAMRGLLVQLLVTLLRYQLDKRFRAASGSSKIADALEAVEKDPAYPWTIPELASLTGYHPTYFAELFRETTGLTPKHYLIRERIRQAQLLLSREPSIEEVAAKLGYSSIHYFCRNFKAVTGLTPSQFRQRSRIF
ncbi:AraC family transcriptional regulator [Paenibacillus sp. CC-CFT747]|nr:AraC family transcriptional regulator [Paenibacillus sp. CC-CFT747]